MLPRLLTIAGSDSGGGAGIQADLKTFQAFGAFGMSAITAVTAQNTERVAEVVALDPAFVALQIRMVAEDIGVDAAKCGMLFSRPIIEAVASVLADYTFPLVLDPVMVAKSGDRLLEPEAVAALTELLLPRATVLTPNVPEARLLAGLEPEAPDEEVAARLLALGPRFVLLKGGHRRGPEVVDWLYGEGGREPFRHPRRETRNTHGTGCTLSAAIAAGLARGLGARDAVAEAICFVDGAIEAGLDLGHGHGPLHHGFASQPFSCAKQG
jgi:hydroxymethylpyrimidine/phosphomethylpyrimidine kinase